MSRKRQVRAQASSPPPNSALRRKIFSVLALATTAVAAWLLWPQWLAHRHWSLGERALQERDYPAASTHFKAYSATYPGSAQAKWQLARSLRCEGKYSEAEQLLESCDWIPEVVELERMLVYVQRYGTRGEIRDVLKGLVYKRHPEERVILEAMFEGDRHVMDFEQAAAWLNAWLEHFPEDPIPRLWRAELLQSFKHLPQARDDYFKLLELQPERIDILLKLGALALADSSDYAAAESFFRRVISHDPRNAEAWLGIARCAHGLGDLEQAAAAVNESLSSQPNNGEACLLMASIVADSGSPEESLSWLRKAEGTKVDEQKLTYQLSQVLGRLGRTEDASKYESRFQLIKLTNEKLEAATTTLIKHPEEPHNHHAIGILYRQLGKEDIAERWFLGALHQDRNFTPSHEALAKLYSSRSNVEDQARANLHRNLARKSHDNSNHPQ